MVVSVKPFKAIFYDQDKVDLGAVLTLPYDVISDEKRRDYLKRSPHNFIQLILPEENGGDCYQHAADLLKRWLDEGVLKQDERPCFYLYEEEYVLNGAGVTQRGLVAAVKIEAYDKRVILPHEQVYDGPLEDRLCLLEATRTDLEMIIGVYSDPSRKTTRLAESVGEPFIDILHGDSVRHRIWRIADPVTVQKLQKILKDKTVIIADGHHRYTTALNYYHHTKKTQDGHILMYLLNMDDDLLVLPTHRMLNVGLEAAELQQLGQHYFDFKQMSGPDELLQALEQHNGHPSFGVYTRGVFLLLTLKDSPQVREALAQMPDPLFEGLDVVVLHKILFHTVMEIPEDTKHIFFSKDASEVFKLVDEGTHTMGVLLNGTRIRQVKEIAEAGYRMPQKSTYFYPKPLSGLLLRPH